MEDVFHVTHNHLNYWYKMQSLSTKLFTMCLLGALWSCNTQVVEPKSLEHEASDLYVRLEMNHRAVLLSTVAPYDTLQLKTIPFGDKDSIWKPTGLSQEDIDSIIKANPPTFISKDSSRIKVTNDGLIRAIKPTTNTGTVQVIATQQINNVTRACTTLVRALPIPNALPAESIVLSSVDTLKIAADLSVPLNVKVFDEADNLISNVVTYVRTSNPDIIRLGTSSVGKGAWNIASLRGGDGIIGKAKIRVNATVFGREVDAEIELRNGHRLSNKLGSTINLNNRSGIYLPPTTIAKGGIISWTNDTIAGIPDKAVDVIFDDPSGVSAAPLAAQNSGSGNIHWPIGDRDQTIEQRTRYRQFNTPGIYPYRVSNGLIGNVIVMEF